MNLASLVISPEDARERLDEYMDLVAEERTAEDEAIAQGYRAASRGLPVIMLSQVINAGGAFPNGLPKLAVLRSDATTCYVFREERNWRSRTGREDGPALIFSDAERAENYGALVGPHTVRVPLFADFPPIARGAGSYRYNRAMTTVPIIPPRFRPKRNRMRTRHILWEVEEWTLLPPKDPALLRHIRGDLWAVLATWDLTDLERAVLAQRSVNR